MKSIRLLSILNLFALLIHITMAVATELKWVNEMDVEQVSNAFPTLFTPAGITFSIWTVIYAALIVMCIYHVLMSVKKDELHDANQAVNRMGWWFIINNIAAAAWLYAWTQQLIGAAEILMVVQLASLIIIHGLLNIQEPEHSLASKFFTQAPLSIYLGWISIAAIANTAVYLTSINWNGWGIDDALWTLVMIGAAVMITMLMVFFRNNILYCLVVIWALRGIIYSQQQLEDAHPSIINAAWIGIGFTGIAILIQAFRMHQYYPLESTNIRAEFSRGRFVKNNKYI